MEAVRGDPSTDEIGCASAASHRNDSLGNAKDKERHHGSGKHEEKDGDATPFVLLHNRFLVALLGMNVFAVEIVVKIPCRRKQKVQ